MDTEPFVQISCGTTIVLFSHRVIVFGKPDLFLWFPVLFYINSMTEISRFFGIRIHMYYKEHGISYFHAFYWEHRASISIKDGSLLAGYYPQDLAFFVPGGASY